MSENPQRRLDIVLSYADEVEEGYDNMKGNEEVSKHNQENHREESCNSSSKNNDEDLVLGNNDDKINDANDDDGKEDISADIPWGYSDDDDDNDFIHALNDANDDTSAEYILDGNDNVDDDNHDNDCDLQRAIRDEEQTIDTIMELIKIFPMEVQHENNVGDYSLHTACDCGDRDSVVIELIKMFPEAVQFKNRKGLYPLHLAIFNGTSEDIVMKLIKVFPEAVSQSTMFGTALHIACRRDPSKTVITKLI